MTDSSVAPGSPLGLGKGLDEGSTKDGPFQLHGGGGLGYGNGEPGFVETPPDPNEITHQIFADPNSPTGMSAYNGNTYEPVVPQNWNDTIGTGGGPFTPPTSTPGNGASGPFTGYFDWYNPETMQAYGGGNPFNPLGTPSTNPNGQGAPIGDPPVGPGNGGTAPGAVPPDGITPFNPPGGMDGNGNYQNANGQHYNSSDPNTPIPAPIADTGLDAQANALNSLNPNNPYSPLAGGITYDPNNPYGPPGGPPGPGGKKAPRQRPFVPPPGKDAAGDGSCIAIRSPNGEIYEDSKLFSLTSQTTHIGRPIVGSVCAMEATHVVEELAISALNNISIDAETNNLFIKGEHLLQMSSPNHVAILHQNYAAGGPILGTVDLGGGGDPSDITIISGVPGSDAGTLRLFTAKDLELNAAAGGSPGIGDLKITTNNNVDFAIGAPGGGKGDMTLTTEGNVTWFLATSGKSGVGNFTVSANASMEFICDQKGAQFGVLSDHFRITAINDADSSGLGGLGLLYVKGVAETRIGKDESDYSQKILCTSANDSTYACQTDDVKVYAGGNVLVGFEGGTFRKLATEDFVFNVYNAHTHYVPAAPGTSYPPDLQGDTSHNTTNLRAT